MFYISCYASADDKEACMFLSYKSRPAAEKRAQKASKTFGRVVISENTEAASAFDFGLNYANA